MPNNKKDIFRAHVRRHKNIYSIGTAFLTTSLAGFLYAHLEQAPVTGRNRFIFVSQEFMDKLAQYVETDVIFYIIGEVSLNSQLKLY